LTRYQDLDVDESILFGFQTVDEFSDLAEDLNVQDLHCQLFSECPLSYLAFTYKALHDCTIQLVATLALHSQGIQGELG
jgi:hypothetical protein